MANTTDNTSLSEPPTKTDSLAVHSYIDWLIGNDEFLRQTDKLRSLGLLEGVQATGESTFLDRLSKGSKEKRATAKYLVNKVVLPEVIRRLKSDGELPPFRAFYESGSTIAYVIGFLARRIRATLKERKGKTESNGKWIPIDGHFLSNNLFGVVAFAGLVKNVEPVQGRFEPTYYGFFPFDDEPPRIKDEQSCKDEVRGFERLANDIRQCDQVLATCSRFSFLTGPLVGSRSNALTKRAMLDGLVQWIAWDRRSKRYSLTFHFEKLVPLSVACQDEEFSFLTPYDCYHVCPPIERDELSCLESLWEAQLDTWRLVNDCSPEKIPPRLEWHAELFNQGVGQTATDQFEREMEEYGTGGQDLGKSWLDFARFVHLVIGLPEKSEKALKLLRKEMDFANSLLERLGHSYRYQIGEGDEFLGPVSDEQAVLEEITKSGVAVVTCTRSSASPVSDGAPVPR